MPQMQPYYTYDPLFFRSTVVIIECFGLEGTLRGHVPQPPCSEQGHLPLDQVAQSPVQPDPACFQGWGINKFLPYV